MRRPSLPVSFVAIALVVGSLLLPGARATAADPIATAIVPFVIADGPLPVAGRPYGLAFLLETETTHARIAGATVELWVRQAGQAAYFKVDAGQTDIDGFGALGTALTKNSYAYLVYRGDASYAADQTEPIFVPVSTAGTIKVNDKSLRIGQRLVVRGKTYPAKPGRRVVLFMGTIPIPGAPPTKMTRLARAYVHADGTYRIRKRFSHAGKKRLFVRLPGGEGNVSGYTRYRRVRVG